MFASSFSSMAETKHNLGAGYQYGGALGYKLSNVTEKSIYFISAGVIGGSVGYQRLLDESKQHSLGVAVGSEVLTSEKGFDLMTYNYYSSGADNSGWVVGLSAGVRREDKYLTKSFLSFSLLKGFNHSGLVLINFYSGT